MNNGKFCLDLFSQQFWKIWMILDLYPFILVYVAAQISTSPENDNNNTSTCYPCQAFQWAIQVKV